MNPVNSLTHNLKNMTSTKKETNNPLDRVVLEVFAAEQTSADHRLTTNKKKSDEDSNSASSTKKNSEEIRQKKGLVSPTREMLKVHCKVIEQLEKKFNKQEARETGFNDEKNLASVKHYFKNLDINSYDLLFKIFQELDAQKELKIILPQILHEIPENQLGNNFIKHCIKKTIQGLELNNSFRSESPGTSLFCCIVKNAFTEKLQLGKKPFATIAICSVTIFYAKQLSKISKNINLQYSEDDLLELVGFFINNITKCLYKNRVTLNPLFKEICSHFFQSVEENRKLENIPVKNWFVSLVMLRCLGPEVSEIGTILSQSQEEMHQVIGSVMKKLGIKLQAVTNKIIDPDQIESKRVFDKYFSEFFETFISSYQEIEKTKTSEKEIKTASLFSNLFK